MAGAVLLAHLVGVGLGPGALVAQQPTRPLPRPTQSDTVRPRQQPGDTLPRPTTSDTVRVRRDSLTVAAPASTDTTRRSRIDSVVGLRDSLKTPRPRADSIQAPIARAEVPIDPTVAPLYRWTRDSVLSTGATSLGDLLDRVPGVTMFRSGWLASAQTATYYGDGTRVRVFRDGLEVDPLDLRAGGIRDVGDIQLGNVDEVTIERSAGEVRVHIRTWSVRNTTPYSRVDAFTGDEDTNLYRFFIGRRFGSGFDAQVGVQQVGTGTRNRRTGGGGSILDALGRVGWARGWWSVDATYIRLDRRRDVTTTFVGQDSVLPSFEGRRSESYFRVGYGDPEGKRPWLQAIASNASMRLSGTGADSIVETRSSAGLLTATDTIFGADSAASRRQYLLTGGYTLGRIRLSGAERLRAFDGRLLSNPSARASFDTPLLSVSAFVERGAVGGVVPDSLYALGTIAVDTIVTRSNGVIVDTTVFREGPVQRMVTGQPRRTSRADLSGRLSPLPWVAVLGSVSRESRTFARISQPAPSGRDVAPAATLEQRYGVTTVRLEAALRLGRMWLTGGVVNRGADTVPPLSVYECIRVGDIPCQRPEGRIEAAATAAILGARGRVYKDVYVDIAGTAWTRDGGPYRPQYQMRSEVGVLTNWLRRFPTGNFGFKFAVIDEYRSRARFPVVVAAGVPDVPPFCESETCAPPSNVLTAQLEIRIFSGVLSYQFRNALNRDYDLVPGIRMPGPLSYYGVRWSFWN